RAYARDSAGAPYLAGFPARFNLSHSRGVALIAVTRRRAIGVDVEGVRALPMAPRRRQQILAIGAGLAGKPLKGSLNRKLLQAWTRIEAFAKARGGGVRQLLTELRVGKPEEHASSYRALAAAARAEAQRCALVVVDLELGAKLIGAVAQFRSAR